MSKRDPKKLRLRRETLRTLTDGQSRRVVGGFDLPTISCGETEDGCQQVCSRFVNTIWQPCYAK